MVHICQHHPASDSFFFTKDGAHKVKRKSRRKEKMELLTHSETSEVTDDLMSSGGATIPTMTQIQQRRRYWSRCDAGEHTSSPHLLRLLIAFTDSIGSQPHISVVTDDAMSCRGCSHLHHERHHADPATTTLLVAMRRFPIRRSSQRVRATAKAFKNRPIASDPRSSISAATTTNCACR